MLTALSLITLNFWGLPQVGTLSLSLLKDERAQVLCEKLMVMAEAKSADVIALQEVWDMKNRTKLKSCGFSYSVDLDDPARMIDSGLLILSRYPLSADPPLRVKFKKVQSGGPNHFDGESSADKSVMLARFGLPTGQSFVVGNTHLVSSYTHYPEYDPYQSLRDEEFQVAIEAVKKFRKNETEPAYLMGDFNTGPIVDGRPNADWLMLTQNLSYDRKQDGVCTTCESNPFHDGADTRLDFIFSISNPGVRPLSEERVFDTKVELLPGLSGYLSDHFGWESRYPLTQ